MNISLSQLLYLLIVNLVGEVNIIKGEFGILQLLTDELDVLVGASAEKDGFQMSQFLLWYLVNGTD